MLVQFPARSLHVSIAAVHSAQQQTLDLPADRTHPTHQRRPRNLAGAIVGPMLEQLARGRSQAFTKPFRPRIAACRSSLENRVSDAPSTIASRPSCQYILARSQVTMPRNCFAQEDAQRRGLARGTHREHREHAGPRTSTATPCRFLPWSPFRRCSDCSCVGSSAANSSYDGRTAAVTWFWIFTVSAGQHG